MKEKKKILNEDIRASKIKLISDSTEDLWEMHLSDAKKIAQEKNLDLMLVWKNNDISIVKMLDYWKFLYKQKKQEQKNKQKSKVSELKTIRITFKIGDHDLAIRKKQAEKFAAWWHPLKITLMLRWRENAYEDIARKKMANFIEMLQDIYKIERNIKKSWNSFYADMQPIK